MNKQKSRTSENTSELEEFSTPVDVETESIAETEKPAPAPEPKKAVLPAKPTMTVDRFVRGKGQLGDAFAIVTKLTDGKTIKRSLEEWTTMYDQWLKAPRG